MKPDSNLHNKAIDAAINESRTAAALANRDSHPAVRLTSIATKFVAENNQAFIIDVLFNYYDPTPNHPNEDIVVRVQILKTNNIASVLRGSFVHFAP